MPRGARTGRGPLTAAPRSRPRRPAASSPVAIRPLRRLELRGEVAVRDRGRGCPRSGSPRRAAPVPAPGSSGARRSSARAAQTASTARMRRRLSTAARSFRAAPQPIETWSSCIALVGSESTPAGAASRRFSATIAACVYWAIINPELTPGSSARNGGRPSERLASRRRSVRRSAIAPVSAIGHREQVAGQGERRPVEVAAGLDPSVGQHHRVVDRRAELRRGDADRRSARASRAAPFTCGAQRSE